MRKIVIILLSFSFIANCGKKSGAISPDGENILDPNFVIAESQGIKIRNKDLGLGFLGHLEGIKTKLIKQQVKAVKRALRTKTKGKSNSKNTKFYVNYVQERVNIEIDDSDPYMGPKDAPITLVEFTSYRCYYCSKVRPTLAKLMKTYQGKIRRVVKYFPLGYRKNLKKSKIPAMAGYCAWEVSKDKYWPFQTILFKNRKKLDIASIKGYAIDTGIPSGKFNQCLNSGKYIKKVDEGMALGQKVGVNGTPAVFINGLLVSGALPFAAFNEIVKDELEKISNK